MSNDPAFNNLIDTLLNSADGSARQKAAQTLGDHVDELDNDEYQEAMTALNEALADPDPSVIGTVMSALGNFNRQGGKKLEGDDFEIHGDAQDDMMPQKTVTCSVCGKPEAIVPEGGCERDDCPYA